MKEMGEHEKAQEILVEATERMMKEEKYNEGLEVALMFADSLKSSHAKPNAKEVQGRFSDVMMSW
jgi:hypothetical protein